MTQQEAFKITRELIPDIDIRAKVNQALTDYGNTQYNAGAKMVSDIWAPKEVTPIVLPNSDDLFEQIGNICRPYVDAIRKQPSQLQAMQSAIGTMNNEDKNLAA